MAGHSRSKNGVAELVIGQATSARTRWLAYALPSTSLRASPASVEWRRALKIHLQNVEPADMAI
ncbi:MAG TPA: hypothetical protein VF778_08365, partial [Xanthobacteraceae bacterium]